MSVICSVSERPLHMSLTDQHLKTRDMFIDRLQLGCTLREGGKLKRGQYHERIQCLSVDVMGEVVSE